MAFRSSSGRKKGCWTSRIRRGSSSGIRSSSRGSFTRRRLTRPPMFAKGTPSGPGPRSFQRPYLQLLRLFSDLGTPYESRHMHAWSGHTYRLTNLKCPEYPSPTPFDRSTQRHKVQSDGTWVYTRVKLTTEQSIRNFTASESAEIAGESTTTPGPQKTFNDSKASGSFPTWRVFIATMTAEEAAAYRYHVLDLTKDWLNVT